MFASINFLFLISLAVTSWIILCYFKQIEDQRLGDTRQHYTMERNFDENLAPCRNNYDIYLNFLCIFACVYVLAKVTQLTESFVARQMRARFSGSAGSIGQQEPSRRPTDAKQHLVREVDALRQQNAQLEHRLQELLPRSASSSSAADVVDRKLETSELQKQLLSCYKSAATTVAAAATGDDVGDGSGHSLHNMNSNNNIFISNRHFHMSRQVFVDEEGGGVVGRPMAMGMGKNSPNSNPCPMINFSPSWQKYIELQKFAIKTPTPASASPSSSPSKEAQANPVPIVVSTEELQTIQGLF